MPSKLTKNRRKEVNVDLLNDKQRMFVKEYLADSSYDATAAARKAGYKQPQQAAGRLMKVERILALIGNDQRKRSKQLGYKADDTWLYICGILDLVPSDYAIMCKDGYLMIKDLTTLPKEIGRFVESFEMDVIKFNGIDERVYKVKLISKATALGLAVKIQNVDKVEVKVATDWDEFFKAKESRANTIETRLIEEENNVRNNT